MSATAMGALILIAMLAGAFAWQYLADRADLFQLATARGWRLERITFAPFAPGWLLRSRHLRAYRLHYRDESGRLETRTCVVGGRQGFRLDPPAGSAVRVRRAPLPLLARLAIGAGGGLVAGMALGIGICFVIFPGSNIAPAYGVIYGAPAGLLAGVLAALLPRR
jgi:hypothetical protein